MIGRPITELKVGESTELTRTITHRMITDFADTIGDENPLHSDPAFAERVSFREPIAPGIMTGGLVSAAIGTQLPGPGTLYMSQEFKFLKPVFSGDVITVRVEVAELIPERNRARLTTVCVNQRGEEVLVGDAWVKPPKERIVYEEHTVAPVALRTQPLPLVWTAMAVQAWSQGALSLLANWRHNATT